MEDKKNTAKNQKKLNFNENEDNIHSLNIDNNQENNLEQNNEQMNLPEEENEQEENFDGQEEFKNGEEQFEEHLDNANENNNNYMNMINNEQGQNNIEDIENNEAEMENNINNEEQIDIGEYYNENEVEDMNKKKLGNKQIKNKNLKSKYAQNMNDQIDINEINEINDDINDEMLDEQYQLNNINDNGQYLEEDQGQEEYEENENAQNDNQNIDYNMDNNEEEEELEDDNNEYEGIQENPEMQNYESEMYNENNIMELLSQLDKYKKENIKLNNIVLMNNKTIKQMNQKYLFINNKLNKISKSNNLLQGKNQYLEQEKNKLLKHVNYLKLQLKNNKTNSIISQSVDNLDDKKNKEKMDKNEEVVEKLKIQNQILNSKIKTMEKMHKKEIQNITNIKNNDVIKFQNILKNLKNYQNIESVGMNSNIYMNKIHELESQNDKYIEQIEDFEKINKKQKDMIDNMKLKMKYLKQIIECFKNKEEENNLRENQLIIEREELIKENNNWKLGVKKASDAIKKIKKFFKKKITDLSNKVKKGEDKNKEYKQKIIILKKRFIELNNIKNKQNVLKRNDKSFISDYNLYNNINNNQDMNFFSSDNSKFEKDFNIGFHSSSQFYPMKKVNGINLGDNENYKICKLKDKVYPKN